MWTDWNSRAHTKDVPKKKVVKQVLNFRVAEELVALWKSAAELEGFDTLTAWVKMTLTNRATRALLERDSRYSGGVLPEDDIELASVD